MREIGRGGKRGYLGGCLDGYGRRRVDHEHVSGYADAETRKTGGGGDQKVWETCSMTRSDQGPEGASGYIMRYGME